MAGKLYGVGVGPGDPELMTLKAIKTVDASDVVVFPGKVAVDTVAYKIAAPVCENLEKKEIVAVDMPMTKDPEILLANYEMATEEVAKHLDAGKDVAFLTLGDPTVYSTYLYVHERIVARGYETEIIPGITSFCATAARLNIGLVEKSDMLHVVPASYDIEDALKLKGTKILMKAASKMNVVKESLKEIGAEAMMIENCGMPNEKIYTNTESMPEKSSYYSLVIVKEKK